VVEFVSLSGLVRCLLDFVAGQSGPGLPLPGAGNHAGSEGEGEGESDSKSKHRRLQGLLGAAPVLDHDPWVAQDVDVPQRIAADGDDVGALALGQRARLAGSSTRGRIRSRHRLPPDLELGDADESTDAVA